MMSKTFDGQIISKTGFKVIRWSSEEDMLNALRKQGFHPTRYTYPPGCAFPPHTHDIDKVAAVLEGRFRITMDNQSVVLNALEGIFVPREKVHAACVVGLEPVVSVDAVSD
ncbi:cupin domain-containing protein [Magnetococcales bacterium HHB-1]